MTDGFAQSSAPFAVSSNQRPPRVGVMRDYWRAPEGTWHDGLLMDLLAREFEPE